MDESTFKTEVDFKVYSKPVIGNITALREIFLSEAPFVNQSNKLFWRKWIESKEFVAMLTAAAAHVQSCINESGCVQIDKLNDLMDSELIHEMASNLADMFFLQKPRDRNIFFLRLPEILSFMITNSLTTWNPKHHRVYNSIKFRELILDFLNELISGIRPTECRRNCEWIFAEANDSQILTSNSNASESSSKDAIAKRCGGNLNRLASVQSTYTIGHSPLINSYLGLGASSHDTNCIKLTLCHLPARPLICLNGEYSLKSVREKLTTGDIVHRSISEGQKRRKELKKEFGLSQTNLKLERHQLRLALKTNLAVLDKKPVSNKRLVAAMAASAMGSSDSLSGGAYSLGGGGASLDQPSS